MRVIHKRKLVPWVSFQSSIPVFNRLGRKGKEYQAYSVNPVRIAFYQNRGVEVWETYQRVVCFSRYKIATRFYVTRLRRSIKCVYHTVKDKRKARFCRILTIQMRQFV